MKLSGSIKRSGVNRVRFMRSKRRRVSPKMSLVV